MGIGASAHVREIRIDQNDESWNRSNGNRGIRSAPSSASGPLNAVKRLRRGSPGARSADRREQQLRNAVEATEKRANEAQNRVRQLERELATLERRNQDLLEEVTWLKQQLTDRPEIPVPPRPSTSGSRPGTSIEVVNHHGLTTDSSLKSKIKRQQEEIHFLQSKLKKDTQNLEAQLEDSKRDLYDQLIVVESKLFYTTKLNEQYEEIIRKNLSQSAVDKAKTSADKLVASAKNKNSKSKLGLSKSSHNNNNIAPSQAALSIKSLRDQVENQKNKVQLLEEQIKQRDLEINRLKEISNITAGNNPSATPDRRRSVSNRPPSPASRNSFHAVRKASLTSIHGQPMRVDRKNTGKVEDEIEALLKTPAELNKVVPDYLGESSHSLPPFGAKAAPNALQNPTTTTTDLDSSFRENIRSVSVAGGRSLTDSTTNLRNIYTLSDNLEPEKVTIEPETNNRPPRLLARPKTAAAVSRHKSTAIAEIHSPVTSETVGSQLQFEDWEKPRPMPRRGASAPMLFKYSEDAEGFDQDFMESEHFKGCIIYKLRGSV